MSARSIVVTADGSHTIRHDDLGVTYHSVHGAMTESKHVFISTGLEHVLATGLRQLRILEVGFGTGLNALLTYLYWKDQVDVTMAYDGVDTDPLSIEMIRQLNYSRLLPKGAIDEILLSMHNGSFHQGAFLFGLIISPIQAFQPVSGSYDLVYYDAFAPGAQPRMWDLETLGHVRDMLRPGAVLVTYCAQGQFKRNLKSLGFRIEGLPGPPGKREIVRATLS